MRELLFFRFFPLFVEGIPNNAEEGPINRENKKE